MPDADRHHVAFVAQGGQELEQHDVLLESLQDRTDGEGEVGAEAHEVGRSRQDHALLTLLDQRIFERADDGANEVTVGRREAVRQRLQQRGRLAELMAAGPRVEPRSQVGDEVFAVNAQQVA